MPDINQKVDHLLQGPTDKLNDACCSNRNEIQTRNSLHVADRNYMYCNIMEHRIQRRGNLQVKGLARRMALESRADLRRLWSSCKSMSRSIHHIE